jgi:hypothetical protein
VQSAVTRHVDVVHNGGMPMVMRGEGQEIGQLMWSTLASISASERNLILQRLTAGVVAKHARGEWTLGKHAIPLGYRLSATGALELDESQAEAVALAWNLLANPWVSLRRVVQELGALGVSSHNLRRTYGPEATVADMAQPKNFVNRMVRYATLHVTGRHTQLLANPFPGATHLASLPVHPPTHERPNGHVKFPFEPGVPSAGWADQRVIEEAIRVRTGARDLVVTERTSPLSSAAWSDGEVAYRIHRTPDGTYAVRGIPLEWTEQ